MWILKIHISVSILLILMFKGFKTVFKDQIKENGWLNDKQKSSVFNYWLFFVPVLRWLLVISLFIMIFCTKNKLDEFQESRKNKSDAMK